MKTRVVHLLILLLIAASTAAGAQVSLIPTSAPVRVLVPSGNSLGLNWTGLTFNDSSWTAGTTGVGYDTNPSPFDYLPLIGLNLQAQMQNINQSAYVRVPFSVGNPADYDSLKLRVKYDDGFVAWLNGIKIASDNAPASPLWDSGAQTNRLDADAVVYCDFDVTEFLGLLIAGQNVIAFQLLNYGENSSDALLLPVLEATTAPVNPSALRIDWSTLDGGGGTSTNGTLALRSTIGQFDAGRLTNGTTVLNGGFWGGLVAVQTRGAPLLSIAYTTTNTVVVFWSSPSTGWVLQQNTNDISSVNWSNTPGTIQDDSTNRTLIVNPPIGNRFYRLFKP